MFDWNTRSNIYGLDWKKKKKKTQKNYKKKGMEAELEGACSYSLEVAYTVSAQSFVLF